MLLIVMPFPPANQRVWRETRAEDEPSELCASTLMAVSAGKIKYIPPPADKAVSFYVSSLVVEL